MDSHLAISYACLYLIDEIESVTERLKDDKLPTEERASLELMLSDFKKDCDILSDMDDFHDFDDYDGDDDDECFGFYRVYP